MLDRPIATGFKGANRTFSQLTLVRPSGGHTSDLGMQDQEPNESREDESAGPRGIRWGLLLGILFWALVAVIVFLVFK